MDAVIAAAIDGRPITADEAIGAVQLLILGGPETTAGALGHTLIRLCADPGTQQDLKHHPERISDAVTEFMRLDPSFVSVARTALRDADLAGRPVKSGDRRKEPACDHRRVNDWEQFLREVSWFVQPGDSVTTGEARPLARGPAAGLPELSALLGQATLTPVRIADDAYELLAWGPQDARRGWLCRPPRDAARDAVPEAHRSFWALCGGIIERFGEPATWWENQNEVLTADAAQVPVADVLDQYGWLWEDDGLEITVDPAEYYAVAVEANGNLTLAHRDNGRLLLFAPDHAFTRVTPLAGSPPYSLLTIDDVPDLTTWIEVSAAAWRQP